MGREKNKKKEGKNDFNKKKKKNRGVFMCFFTHVGVFYGRIIFKINENND